ncbi:MAG: SRPBCC family protein [Holophaga sp.]|nr:SRPBCC family protein [Holophaga sp.]
MREEIFLSHQDVPRPRAEVFAFFSDPANLEKLTPPWLSFRILTPEPLPRGEGALFEYQLRVHGLSLRWRTLIESWQEGERFTDRQVMGPYALWHHTHTFEDLPSGGTRITDRVRYRAPFGILGRLVTELFLRRDVEGIFDYRKRAIGNLFN